MDGIEIGLSSMRYAILDSDTASAVVYQGPVAVEGAISAKISPSVNSDTLYADDGPAETAVGFGEISVELELATLPLTVQAALLGHTITGGVITKKSTDTAPYVALGFKSQKSNGKYVYVWLYKGKFSPVESEYSTKKDKPEFHTPKIKATFVKRVYDNAWMKSADEDHPDYVASIGANWFTAVDGAADTTAPTLTSVVPANNATGVAVSSTVVWTFSEAILASTATTGNFMVVNDSDGAVVAGTVTINAARTVVTFTPTSNLAALTAYRAIATSSVKDIAGNAYAGSVSKFTTA